MVCLYIQSLIFTFLVAIFSTQATSEQQTLTSTDEVAQLLGASKSKNIDICFALAGSKLISKRAFKQQKEVINGVITRMNRRKGVRFSAVQYAVSNVAISPLTGNSKHILRKLRKSKQMKSKRSFATAGINYCFSQLYQNRGKRIIVFLGDGRGNLGIDAVRRAKLFIGIGGKLYSVAVGRSPNWRTLTAIVGGDKRKLFKVKGDKSILKAVANIVRFVSSG